MSRRLRRLTPAGVLLGRRVTRPSTVRDCSRIESAVREAGDSTTVAPEVAMAAANDPPAWKSLMPGPAKVPVPVTGRRKTAMELAPTLKLAPKLWVIASWKVAVAPPATMTLETLLLVRV